MKFYFFSTVPAMHAPAFKAFYGQQNLKVLRVTAAIIGCFSLGLLLLSQLLNFGSPDPVHLFFLKVNTGLALVSLLTLAGTYLPRSGNSFFRSAAYTQGLAFLFGFSYTLSCLSVSFVQQENPKNTLTMYLLGLTAVAILWTFEYWQHLLFVLLTELAFILGLQLLPDLSPSQQLLNYIVSVFLITFFFVVARVSYSFRANHFLQLAEIEAKNQKLQDLGQHRTELMGIVAHDLLSPFASIESMIKLLRKKQLTPEKQQEYFDLLITKCQASRHLINDLLEAARYETDETFETELTDLNQFMEEMHAKWQAQLKDLREITFTRCPAPAFVNLNPERFERILDNLLTNAVKFTPANGQIALSLYQQDQQVALHITDNGIGIPADLQPYLFQRFSRARRKGLLGETSTGLGLNITQQLVAQHKGSISFKSAENEGTTFQVVLPAAP
ncbi:MAG TPA: HAMP domain-containing sensor histidine kinase [Adhaeribacter sp.]|nr:HAMP domain-containing sensor histidine kinase [Adhaeribacter sp.]